MKEKLMKDLKEAMKEKDTIKKNTIQSIRAAILQYEKDNQLTVVDNVIIDIISKEKKKRQDALEQFTKANREDLILQTNKELEVLNQYLPKQLDDVELSFEVSRIINEVDAKSPLDMGIVMRAAKEQIGNKVDGKRLSNVVKQKLIERNKK